MLLFTSLIVDACQMLSWTGIEAMMLIIAVTCHVLWTGHPSFINNISKIQRHKVKEIDGRRPCAASLTRKQRKLEVADDFRKLCWSGTLLGKEVDCNTESLNGRDVFPGCDLRHWRSAVVASVPVRAVSCKVSTWAVQLSMKDSLLMYTPVTCGWSMPISCITCNGSIEASSSLAHPGLIMAHTQRWSIMLHGHRTPQGLACDVLHMHGGQCVTLMKVTVDFPIVNVFSSCEPPGMMPPIKAPLISVGLSFVDNNAVSGLTVSLAMAGSKTAVGCIENAESSEGEVATEQESLATSSDGSMLQVCLSNVVSPPLHSPQEAPLRCTKSDFSSDPAFIRHPGGSLMLVVPFGYMEVSAPGTPPPEVQPPTSQLRETARALRNAVEREVASEKLRMATVRKGLLRRLLVSEVLINLASGVVCVWCGTPNLTPQNWEVSVSSLLTFWWMSSISHCFVGLFAIRSARESYFSMLSALALATAVGQMWLACAVMNSVYPDGPQAAIIGAISILWDLPLRLAVGSQAWLVQVDLRYLLLVRAEVFASIDSFGLHNA